MFEDGSNLLDSQNAEMLDWARRLVWSLSAAPGDGAAALKPGSLRNVGTGLRPLLSWMQRQGISEPLDLTPNVIDNYIDDLRAHAVDEAEGADELSGLSEGQVESRLTPLIYLWRQRFILDRAGIAAMPAYPFSNRGFGKLVKEIASRSRGSYRPLPDEVAIPIMNTAQHMLGVPAEDVLRLQEKCDAAYDYTFERFKQHSVHHQELKVQAAQRVVAEQFHFSEIDGVPWHPSIGPDERSTVECERFRGELEALIAKGGQIPILVKSGGRSVDFRQLLQDLGRPLSDLNLLKGRTEVYDALRAHTDIFLFRTNAAARVVDLVQVISSAAHIVLQSTTGMRISEIAGVSAGLDPKTGLPSCVEIRDSVTGLGEIFVLSSKISKIEEVPTTVEWVLGYRPKGADHLPPAVRALLILNRLHKRHRTLLGTNDLFVTITANLGLPRAKGGVSRVASGNLLQQMKDFIAAWVDLSHLPNDARRKTSDNELVPYRESHGRIVKTHQWRKTFATFAYMVDADLLPALQMHYHHISIAMTDGSYVQNNPILMRDMHDLRRQQMSFTALEIASGGTHMAGRYGEELEEKIQSSLGPRIADASADKAYREAFVFVEEEHLDRLFFEPHGLCGAKSANEMSCHAEAGTQALAEWGHTLAPNYATRTPTLCLGCASFAIAKWHRPFWENRYIEHEVALRSVEANCMTAAAGDTYLELTRRRSAQSFIIARRLGAHEDDLEARCEKAFDEVLNGSA
ncbi:MAG: hypothetical protein CME80_17795 [Halomonas sp.]|nr:hypothetical protein [Halomonas sp.]